MSPRNSAVRRRRAATLLLMILPGTACHAWHTERVAPESVLVTRRPAKLRVTRTDASQVVIVNPVLRGDTLSGTGPPRGERQDVRIPLTDVRQVATRRFSIGRTVGLGVGVAAGLFAGVAIICSRGNNCSFE